MLVCWLLVNGNTSVIGMFYCWYGTECVSHLVGQHELADGSIGKLKCTIKIQMNTIVNPIVMWCIVTALM